MENQFDLLQTTSRRACLMDYTMLLKMFLYLGSPSRYCVERVIYREY